MEKEGTGRGARRSRRRGVRRVDEGGQGKGTRSRRRQRAGGGRGGGGEVKGARTGVGKEELNEEEGYFPFLNLKGFVIL